MNRPPVMVVLGGLFALSVAGRASAVMPTHAVPGPGPGPVPPAWSELDQWSAALDRREDEVEATSIAADIKHAQAERIANAARPAPADPARVRRLAALYAAMPPGRAASVLSPMAPDEAATVLGAMAPAAAGAVMAAMAEADARAVGAALAR